MWAGRGARRVETGPGAVPCRRRFNSSIPIRARAARELETRFNEWQGWQRCPRCGMLSLPRNRRDCAFPAIPKVGPKRADDVLMNSESPDHSRGSRSGPADDRPTNAHQPRSSGVSHGIIRLPGPDVDFLSRSKKDKHGDLRFPGRGFFRCVDASTPRPFAGDREPSGRRGFAGNRAGWRHQRIGVRRPGQPVASGNGHVSNGPSAAPIGAPSR